VKKRESGIAYASSRIRPFPLAALPTAYSCEQNFPAKVQLGNGNAEQHSG
jgi:hypothetical protein